ncbi:MAG: GPR1/FUN34/YaaH family transporter [Solirubrobacteraceae bacterium]
MSATSQAEALDTTLPELAGTPQRVAGADPLVLGLPLIAVGAFALGLQLVGYVNASSNGSPLAVLIGASGLGLLVSTWWAASLRVAPVSSPWAAGTSLPTTVLGSLAAFFLSYATLVLGLVHGWFGVKPSDIQHTIALFQISWLAAFLLLAAASVRLPAAFTILFAAFAVALILLLIDTLGPSSTAGKIAGILTLLIGVAASYVFLAIASRSSGGREYPIGRPISK